VAAVITAPFSIDRRAVMRAFSRAAPDYEAAARLERRVRAELLDRLQFFPLKPAQVLDLGAATCESTRQLHERFPRAQVLAVDLTEAMLRAAPETRWPWQRAGFARVCADAAALPLRAQSVDLIFSNLMLQWCDRPQVVFEEFVRVLRPGGLLLFSTFGPDTLGELRAAWAAADDGSHVSAFADMHELGNGLMQAGLAEPVLDVEHHRLHYADARALMRELKLLGARNAAHDRARGLTGRRHLDRMLTAYEGVREEKGLPATFEVISGAAFADDGTSHAGRHSPHQRGEFAIPVTAIRSARR
jgi:malonyl-CoA O-methyltransferase